MDQTYFEGFEEAKHPEHLPHRYHWATDRFRDTAGVAPSFPYVKDNLIEVTPSNLSTSWTAGGMISSVHDLLKFASALRDGRLLDSASKDILKDWKPFSDSSQQALQPSSHPQHYKTPSLYHLPAPPPHIQAEAHVPVPWAAAAYSATTNTQKPVPDLRLFCAHVVSPKYRVLHTPD
ncbi:hypothetical protein ZTR_08088 [Talaromyces verruculosus]|nr:hypothetical protein ZTR_08088 [Talaromyces verruculosus]